jgi:hypothetical protein
MIILFQECDPNLSKDKTLPRDSYLVSYLKKDELSYDISRGSKVELFDYYYDNYGNVQSIEWTSGIVNPKVYDYIPKENRKKK